MFLKQINLTNFRNYSSLSLEFDSRPTILLGNNAAGKSNILESIYFLSTTKSQRVEKEEELIKKGESFCRVSGIVYDVIPANAGIQKIDSGSELDPRSSSLSDLGVDDLRGDDNSIDLEITLQISDNQFFKRVKVNGISKRTVDFIGNLPAVIFYPSDINLVTGPPSLRRWHLDLGLAQVDQNYKKALTLYEQILINRNKVLKRIREGLGHKDELDYWTNELVEKGKVVGEKRKGFFNFANNLDKPLGSFRFEYKESPVTMEKLDQINGREVAAAVTLIGPHRDDFGIIMEGRNLAHFGSRGEQRIATLAFKLSQLEYMAKILGKRPLLLLDDVFSELDVSHKASVVEIVGKQQTIIATVELENIPKQFLDSARILRVEGGKIIDI